MKAMKTSRKNAAARADVRRSVPVVMTREEKEAFIAQTEEFEGPSRREIRRTERPVMHEPGVSSS